MMLEQVRLFQEHFEIADDIDALTERLLLGNRLVVLIQANRNPNASKR
jgi:hypothetical protein